MISFCQDIHISYEYHYQVGPTKTTKKPSSPANNESNSLGSLDRQKKYKIEVLSKRQNSPRSESEKQFIGIQISNPNKNIYNQPKTYESSYSRQIQSNKTIKYKNKFPQKETSIEFHSPTVQKNIQVIRAKHRRTGSHQVGICHQKIEFNFSKISQKKVYNFFNQLTIKKSQPTTRIQNTFNKSMQIVDLQKSNETKIFKKMVRPLQIDSSNNQFLKTVEIDSDYEHFNDTQTPGKKKNFKKMKNINELSSIDNKQTLKLPAQKKKFVYNKFRKSILNDAVSIVSKNFQESSFSMVDPGQVFFYQSQILSRQSNFIAIGKNIQQKTYSFGLFIENLTGIICSLKQYQKQCQKYFLNEHQIYRLLQKQGGQIEQILNLYQIMPNSQNKKLLMIKQPFTNDLLTYLRQNHAQKKQMLIHRVMSQIKKIIKKLQSLSFYIKQQQTFQIKDFVEYFNQVKLQNLSKFQRIYMLKKGLQISNQRNKIAQIKLDILQMKIKRQLPQTLKI